MRYRSKSTQGFTLVELLIVIVVIAILAAITLVAYNGIQAKANDSRRLQDVSDIEKSLLLYKINNGSFPASAPNPGNSSFEISTDPGFLSSLASVDGNHVFSSPSGSTYYYHTFAAGQYGCPASMGPFYVLWIQGMQSQQAEKFITNGCDAQTLFATTNPPPSGAYPADKGYYLYFGF